MKRFNFILFVVSSLASARVIVTHSQTTVHPTCPGSESKVLWQGYSFLGVNLQNGERSAQKLGSTGSCLEQYIRLPMIECGNKNCDYRKAPHRSMWLARTLYGEAGALNSDAEVKSHMSRCTVCDSPYEVLVRHSFNSNIPVCPTSWEKAWDGYSFGGVAIESRRDTSQSLSDPGSCLKAFTPVPLIGCRGTKCWHGDGGHKAIWIHNAGNSNTNLVNHSSNSAGNAARTSRCAVCIKRAPE